MKRQSIYSRIRERGLALCIFSGFLIGLLVLGYAYRQIINSDKYVKYAESQSKGAYYINSPRGTIEDCNGRPLAQSVIAYSLFADPAMLSQMSKAGKYSPEKIAELLAPYLDISREEILKRITEKDTGFVWLERRMDRRQYLKITKILDDNKINAVAFKEEYRRYYPNGSMLAQVLGFVGVDNIGLSGMEARLEEYIKGVKTKVQLVYDAQGHVILESVLTDRVPKERDTAKLTIDTTVQFIAEAALAKEMEKSHAVSGSVIVMDSHTGDILAMVNQPSFEPSHYNDFDTATWKNGAVTNSYEPGSTFKPVIAAAALASGKWKVDEVYDDPGYIQIDDRTIKNWDKEANGKVTLLEILKASINTGMVHIGMNTGPDILLDYIDKFGFGKQTDIELPGEAEGILYNKKTILPVNTATMSIGQGVAVTPLQMVQAFSAFANHGKMVQPHIIKEIISPNGKVIKKTETKVVGTPIPENVVDSINKILEQEVSSGGGHKAHLAGYEFCGKTGTAEIPDYVHGGYYKGRYVASFIGYGPLPNPRFVVLIVVNQPQGIYYGAQVAAPVFRDIASQLVRYYQISPTVMQGDSKKEIKQHERNYKVGHTPDGNVIVPSFYGWSMGEVAAWINQAHMKFKPHGSGFVKEQEPPAGSVVEEGTEISAVFK